VLQEAFTAVVTDRASPLQGVVGGEVQLGRVVDDQDHRFAGHGGAGQLPVGLLQAVHGSLLAATEVVETAQLVPVEDRGEGDLRVGGDGGGGVNQAVGAARVAQLGSAEVYLCPLLTIRDSVHGRYSSSHPGLLLPYPSMISW
jgi:hypothetical protein